MASYSNGSKYTIIVSLNIIVLIECIVFYDYKYHFQNTLTNCPGEMCPGVDNFTEIASPVPNYASPPNK